jgi:hypothetical protein
VSGQADLVEVVGASRPARRLADFLDGWQEQPIQDRNDGDLTG